MNNEVPKTSEPDEEDDELDWPWYSHMDYQELEQHRNHCKNPDCLCRKSEI